MNYRIFTTGIYTETYDKCIKLLLHSAKASDYLVSVDGFEKLTPHGAEKHLITLKGSSKNIYSDIAIDFDNLIRHKVEQSSKSITLSAETLEVDIQPNMMHYWSIIGAIFKIISDLSPAYVTGYLLENNMKQELDAFNSYLSRLPFAIQIAVNELITDVY